MAWRSSGRCNKSLVENLWTNGMIKSDPVKDAFLAVDRAHYAPSSPYEDSPQGIGHRATISAPHMHANAAESLLPYLLPSKSATRRPRRVLDIGSGSGYLTHIFAELAGGNAVVVGVEHIAALRDLGESNMRKSPEGRELLASGRVRFRVGDGRKGWVEPETLSTSSMSPSAAEAIEAGKAVDGKDAHGRNVGGAADESDAQGWDAIHVGAAAAELHEDLVKQLRKPGRMFIPVEDEGGMQYIWVVDKDVDGNIEKKRLYGVRYVPLTDAPRK
ncbi:protein-L-isoaspartate O-methyltransferase-domain-containing protein [Xylaria bambusicola]|uniref:protein-L-isoaspartate O-methyltransferase-domain-containing protein n=1 Tax=Xylaria bambusicola TaxID=326684 RepID=UPI00200836AF|nr:protein-L-isoaspartate O-methyltransferase-domain-containing protein [Xylaria bambusicola]KAI0508743.1 protein-L-isoaspartate O-methyltransferase-domain-containing protein [Xylaria bambusicola]